MSSALDAPIHLIGQSQTSTPKFIYGTAWKKDRTGELVYQALKAGFRGIDTAAQPKHYQEALVGDGIRRAIAEGIVKREELYVRYRHPVPTAQTLLFQAISADQPRPDPNQIHTTIRPRPKEHALRPIPAHRRANSHLAGLLPRPPENRFRFRYLSRYASPALPALHARRHTERLGDPNVLRRGREDPQPGHQQRAAGDCDTARCTVSQARRGAESLLRWLALRG